MNVSFPEEKEKILHQLLEEYHERVNDRREFFRVTPDAVRPFFQLMGGEWWEDEEEKTEDESSEDDEDDTERTNGVAGCRDMAKCFKDGQKIRHVIGTTDIWVGTYDSKTNKIMFEGKPYTINLFALSHIRTRTPTRQSVNAWQFCECEIDGKWVSTYSLPG